MRIIGLTGGIASGKSTVARMLEKRGATVIDADRISREVVAPGEPAYKDIVAAFGEGILNPDRTINRGALGSIVFADPEARRRLEKITHPAIGRRASEKLEDLRRSGATVVFYMAPLLIEAGITSRVDEIWVVYVDRETQVERLMGRDGINRDEALRKIATQMPMDEKREHGRVVIDNRGTEAETERQLQEAWEREIQGSGSGEQGPGTGKN
jgi:dephospho-CoA kinase